MASSWLAAVTGSGARCGHLFCRTMAGNYFCIAHCAASRRARDRISQDGAVAVIKINIGSDFCGV
jgi:hypothetical protein